VLAADELRVAMAEAVEQVGRCTRLCSAAAVVVEGGYLISHTGLGGSDTAVQHVYAAPALAWGQSMVRSRLRNWLHALHDHAGEDFNDYAAEVGAV
jgi:deoxycytidylate deaminase